MIKNESSTLEVQLSGLSNISLEIFSICSSTWRMISVLVSLTLTIIFGADLRSGIGRTGLIPDSCSILFFSCSESSTSYWNTCIIKDFFFHFWLLKVIWYHLIRHYLICNLDLRKGRTDIYGIQWCCLFSGKLKYILISKFTFSKKSEEHFDFFPFFTP